ncbi:MAG: phytanoyl-CoA dioxygenase [Candidatus Latescibacteria bacterium]|nr:phytanoyl-CoA dioxygenase [Candidatus Latescibacterota bacterium]
MSANLQLLDDAGMQSFIADGYTMVETDFAPEYHQSVYHQLKDILGGEGNPGNNLLPRVPDLQQVFDHPRVAGALTSVLGPDYYMHPHRFCHFNQPGSQGQQLHKDSWSRRHHRPRWAMAFYYPQDTPIELGPTGIVPGTQYHNSLDAEAPEREVGLTGAAGTVGIVHYDLWHRAMPNSSQDNRYMVKFLFVRLEEPEGPCWDTSGAPWAGQGQAEEAMWQSIWEWCGGQTANGAIGAADQAHLLRALESESEAAGQAAAYALGRAGEAAVGPLVDCLRSESEQLRRNAGYGLAAAGEAAVEALAQSCADADLEVRRAAVDSLADMGRPGAAAVGALQRALTDESDKVRGHAAEALGALGPLPQAGLEGLAGALTDQDEWVRRNAALGLARQGAAAEAVQPAVAAALDDDNRYVSAKAAKTLERIGTEEASEILFDYLFAARWCPLTTKDTPY